MELLILLIIALILLAWRINSEMSAIKPPSYPLIQKQQEDQSNFVPTEDEEDRMRKCSSVDACYNDHSAASFLSSSFLDNDSTSSHDDDNRSSIFDDHWSSSNWDYWTSSGFDDWGSSSWDSWSSSSWDS